MNNYFEKLAKNPYDDWYWNLPEMKQGSINVIGGSAQSFQLVIKTAEFLSVHYPLEQVKVVLPDALSTQLPSLPNFVFLPSTQSGGFTGDGLGKQMGSADYNLIIGDFSKNAQTTNGVAVAMSETTTPALVTRDAVDIMIDKGEAALKSPQLNYLLSAVQLQKMMRAVYYPKMLTLSQPLVAVAELLHKFTLSYDVGIAVLYNGQILAAKDGAVRAVSLESSGYSPITIWNGELAGKIAALSVYNPGDFVAAVIAAIYHKV